MRILLTRAEDAATRMAERLKADGHEIIATPLLDIEALPFAWPPGPFDALIATSANAFAGMEAPGPFTALPLYTVGARTAHRAREAGFPHAIAKGRDSAELTDYLLGDLPVSTRFLYLAGVDRRPQLETRLRQAGRHLVIIETYRANPRRELTDQAREAMADGRPLTVLHFSPRSARLFLQAAGDAGTSASISHMALSAAAAAPLRAAGLSVKIPATPDGEAMLALVGRDEGEDIGQGPIPDPRLEGDHAAMSDDTQHADRPPRADTTRPEPPVIEANAARPAPPAGPILTAALGGGLVGAALIGVGLWAVAPSNDQAERLAALENTVGSMATRRTVEALDKRIGAVETRLPDLEAAAKRPMPAPVTAQASAPNAANDDGQLTRALQDMRNELAILAQRLATLEQASADQAAKMPAPEKIDTLNRDIAQLGQRIAITEKNIAASTPGVQDGGGLAVAVALKTKLQDGQPFAREFAALQGLNADPSALAILKPYADKGLPGNAALAAAFAAPARAIASAPSPRANGDAPWTDKISSALGRMVRVTPVDPGRGEDPVSLTVRIQTALAKDDSAEALALWRKLPEPARRDTAAFGRDLEARVSAEQAVSQLMAGMVERLGAKKP